MDLPPSRTTCCAPRRCWPSATYHATARSGTLRWHLITIPARLTHRGRDQIVLHLPQHWPWYDAWDGLFDATHRAPPARAA